MFVRLIHIPLLVLLWLALVGCDRTIHEYPGQQNFTLTVCCTADLADPEYYSTVECDPERGASYVVRAQGVSASDTRFTEPVCLRYVVDLYRVTASSSQFVERQVHYAEVDAQKPQAVATFRVDAQNYKVLVWCDYARDDDRRAWYYNTSDLRHITYTDIALVDFRYKDAFAAVLDVDLTDFCYIDGHREFVYDIDLVRPSGKYRCITTDMADYLKSGRRAEDVTAVVTYTQYVSAGYDVLEQKPNYFEPTRRYITKARVVEYEGRDALELCYDYVFVNGKQTNVRLNLEFYDGEVTITESGDVVGEKISQWLGIVVPLKRNMETIIEGRMLTTSFGTGGFGIDPSFEGEFVIPWGD